LIYWIVLRSRSMDDGNESQSESQVLLRHRETLRRI
jgi:hypothetical protein